MARVELAAPAKVNLHLSVLGRRPDGFHDLRSLVQEIDLADRIVLRTAGAPGSVALRGCLDVPLADNLIARAVERFRSASGVRAGLTIDVEKQIPAAAGFGGGSSDAAATLRGLQLLFGEPLAAAALEDIAAALGSDVPFFLGGAAALLEGRGERLRPLAPRTDYAIVAVTPLAAVMTADAYRWLDEGEPAAPRRHPDGDEIARSYRQDPVGAWPFTNAFDGPVMGHLPAAARARDRLLASGAAAARLTGSGSTVIGIFGDLRAAEACALRLAEEPPAGARPEGVRLVRPLDSPPPVRYYG